MGDKHSANSDQCLYGIPWETSKLFSDNFISWTSTFTTFATLIIPEACTSYGGAHAVQWRFRFSFRWFVMNWTTASVVKGFCLNVKTSCLWWSCPSCSLVLQPNLVPRVSLLPVHDTPLFPGSLFLAPGERKKRDPGNEVVSNHPVLSHDYAKFVIKTYEDVVISCDFNSLSSHYCFHIHSKSSVRLWIIMTSSFTSTVVSYLVEPRPLIPWNTWQNQPRCRVTQFYFRWWISTLFSYTSKNLRCVKNGRMITLDGSK